MVMNNIPDFDGSMGGNLKSPIEKDCRKELSFFFPRQFT